MSSQSSPTTADIPMTAHTGTRNGISTSSTMIIIVVAIARLLRAGRKRVSAQRRTARELPVEADQLGYDDVDGAEQQRQHEQRLGPAQHAGGEHAEKLKGLD